MRIEKFSKLWIVKLLSICRNHNMMDPTTSEQQTTGQNSAKNQRKWFMKWSRLQMHVTRMRVHGYLTKDLLPKRRRKWLNSSVLFSIGSYLRCLLLELLLLLAQLLPMHWAIEISSSKFLMLTDFINYKLKSIINYLFLMV